ncbi:efflux RND transporter periplasmic adaptor subunit [Candidatus Peregrinibacteria bacterium]|nr:efflux RND transporter periplasmic adaptor subunit [Candidatus Peregrinibacteria bacterium]
MAKKVSDKKTQVVAKPKNAKKSALKRVSMLPMKVMPALKKVLSFAKRRWLLLLVGSIVALPVIGIAYFLLAPEKLEVITETAKRGTLLQTVEAVGTVISEKDLELKFPITGVVDELLIEEGDDVEAGQILATLRSTKTYRAEVSAAYANVQAFKADLQELVEGTRPEEIAIAEAEVANRRASLDLARTTLASAEANLKRSENKLEQLLKEASASLTGDITSVDSLVLQKLSSIETSLNILDDVFATTIIENSVEFHSERLLESYRNTQREAKQIISSALSSGYSSDYEMALDKLTEAQAAATMGSSAVEIAYQVIVSTPLSNYFTNSIKETYKDKIADERSAVQTSLTSITTELEGLRDATEGYRTGIAAEEGLVTSQQGLRDKALTDISTYETLLLTQEAQLALKKAGARDTDIQSAQARVNKAYADLQRANARLEDVILKAPIDGRITKANLKTGEFTGDFQDFDRSITMLGDSPYRVELYASEIDIPKVQFTQSGAIELDAYPDRDFWMSVSEIDPAASIIDGVPKYRIKLDFAENVEDILKIGMTGDVDIITDVRINVVHVPGRAIMKDKDGNYTIRLLIDGEVVEKPIVVGMETDTDVEIISGVDEGDTVVVLVK